MRRLTLALVLASTSLACSGSSGDSSGDVDGGDDTAIAPGDGGGVDTQGTDGVAPDGPPTDAPPGDGGVDAGPIPPPPATCTAPVSAVDTSKPTTVVGTGTSASCTEAALTAAIAKAGIITFDCGGPATITITKTLELRTDANTTIDGGGKVTLDGGGAVRVLEFNHADFRKSDVTVTLQHLTITRGHAKGTDAFAPAPAPCSQGWYDGEGGAIRVRDGVLVVIDSTFVGNQAAELGPDVGGGAIYLAGSKKAIVVGSTFKNNQGSNGGAIGALNSELDVYNSVFDGNTALGNGANSDDASKCSVVAKTGQHEVGSGGNGGAIVIDGGSDGTHTFCGSKFTNNTGGAKALGGAIFRTPDGSKQTTDIDRCLFTGNKGESGVSLYFHNSTLNLTASTFANNVGVGAGIQADGTTLNATNVTFSGNEATAGLGAGMALFGVTGKLLNCTFVGNKAEGGDAYFAAAIFGSPTLTIDNTLFVNDTAKNSGAPMQCQVTATGGGDLQWPRKHLVGTADDALCVPGITFADPLLGALGDHGGAVTTVLPGAGSPAIGIGKACPPTDARGKTRKADGCTAGAAEPD